MALYGPVCQDCYSSEKYDQDSLHQKIKNHPPFQISQLQHVTPDKSQFLFYQHVIKENKTFLTMFYTLIGFHLV